MLELSPTIRQPNIGEIPELDNDEVRNLIKKRETANLVEGYKLVPNTEQELPFNFYGTININNSRLWDLFISLTKILPDRIGSIYNFYDEEPFYGQYLPKNIVINTLSSFKLELTQDGFLEFGVIFNTEDKLEEIFITEAKYIKFWGVNENSFRQIMNEFKLQEIQDINFIDEYPKVVESLYSKNKTARNPEMVIKELKRLLPPKKKGIWQFWK